MIFRLTPAMIAALFLGLVTLGHAQKTVFGSLNMTTNSPAAKVPVAPVAPAAPVSIPSGSTLSADDSDSSKVNDALQTALQLMNQGQTEAALGKIALVLRMDPKNRDAYIMRGNIHTQKKEWGDAMTDYQAALAIDPNIFTAKFNLAEIEFRQKQYDAARERFVPLEAEKDTEFSDLSKYKVFLCDLFGNHENTASSELAVFNQVGSEPSYYFGNASWALFHHRIEDARGWLESAYHIYAPKKIYLYRASLKDMGYLPLPAPSESALPAPTSSQAVNPWH